MAEFPFCCSKTILAFYIFASSITQSTVNVHFLVDFAAKFSLNSTVFIADLNSGKIVEVVGWGEGGGGGGGGGGV